MKTLAIVLLGLAVGFGLLGLWPAMSSMAYSAFAAWTWNDDDDDLDGDEEQPQTPATEKRS